MSDGLWQHVNAYWAEDPATRPFASVVVWEITWPPPRKSKASSQLSQVSISRPISAVSSVSLSRSSSTRSSLPKPVAKPSGYILVDQTVVLTGGMETFLERAHQQEMVKRKAFIMRLVDYSEAGRFHTQNTVVHHKTSEPLDPDEIISLSEFV
ncbi:hypothetical protein MVEN_00972900 [Mycena venus]|uniref:Uncharacterized protein n=1 Tax=Mycena venus TaxID=2733690 RepID=A0A8H6Y8P9_9AGAR|nr:hypothetical protein MVEN_00972900 [Mycena venus]